MRTLILYSSYLGTKKASYYNDWLNAFQNCPHFDVTAQNIVPPYLKVANPSKYKNPQGLKLKRKVSLYQILYQSYTLGYTPLLEFLTKNRLLWNLSDIPKYDLIILLHSTNADSMLPLSILAPYLKNRKGMLLIFVGNEYCLMPDKLLFINETAADYVASQLPENAARWLYSDCTKSEILLIPHGLNSKKYREYHKQYERKVDIGFIGDEYSFAIGDIERTKMIEYFVHNGHEHRFKTDIRLGRKLRIPQKQYVEFLNSIRGTIGAESGTYFLEKTDKIQKQIETFLSRYPESTFTEVYNRFIKKYPNPVNGKAVSSRHFEAVGTKTCQILLDGYYNGILKPDAHYLALNKDFSNIQDVLERFRDRHFVQKLVDDTYEYVMEWHTYDHRILDVWNTVSK